jgi:glycosyltransferase involved in cell wall biosynthesis
MKICFVVSEDWYFCSHRFPLALEALNRGWDVCLIARMSKHGDELRSAGIRTIHMEIDRGGLNPVNDWSYSRRLAAVYRKEKPDIIHHVAMKPCLFGSIAAWMSGQKNMVNAIAGLGSAFSADSLKMKLIRPFVRIAFKQFLGRGNSKLLVQNTDDFREFEQQLGFPHDQIRLIRGSGVDMDEFCPNDQRPQNDIPMIVLVSRLLIEKGIPELIEAGRILQERNVACRIVLVGDADKDNSHSVSEEMLSHAVKAGWVEEWGRRSDIAAIYRQTDIAVLPSYYREGIPKTLLEAAASGLPIVTTDSVGCRETVDDGMNGYLVPVKQSEPLADALEKLIRNKELRERMGQKSREKALAEFDIKQVVKQTFDIYDEILSLNKGSHS